MYAASFFIVVFVLPKEKEERKRVITLAKIKQKMAARGSWTRAPFFWPSDKVLSEAITLPFLVG